jgi:hypothetical protein
MRVGAGRRHRASSPTTSADTCSRSRASGGSSTTTRASRTVELSNWGDIFLNRELPQIMAYAFERGVALRADNGGS